MRWCALRSDKEQELCESGDAALFPCTASAGGWPCSQQEPECQVQSLDLGLVMFRKGTVNASVRETGSAG